MTTGLRRPRSHITRCRRNRKLFDVAAAVVDGHQRCGRDVTTKRGRSSGRHERDRDRRGGRRNRLMSSTESNITPRQDTVWWYGGVMEIKIRAEDTGSALGVVEGHFPYKGYGPALHVH